MDVWGFPVMRCHIGLKHRRYAMNRALSQLLAKRSRMALRAFYTNFAKRFGNCIKGYSYQIW
jgi:hypothetical protein